MAVHGLQAVMLVAAQRIVSLRLRSVLPAVLAEMQGEDAQQPATAASADDDTPTGDEAAEDLEGGGG